MMKRKGKKTEDVVFHKMCPMFKTKCKRDECVFYKEEFDWNYIYIGKNILKKVSVGTKTDITFSAKMRIIDSFGKCKLKDCRAVHIRHIYIPMQGETFTDSYTSSSPPKTRPWWRFW